MDFLTLIPFEEYEKDIDNGPEKENKQEILNLFQNSNLHSIEEFDKIKSKLHEACKLGELELINILLQETINNESNEFTFKIDKKNQTASLFKVNKFVINIQLYIVIDLLLNALYYIFYNIFSGLFFFFFLSFWQIFINCLKIIKKFNISAIFYFYIGRQIYTY